jgi:uncharacterized SAM-binding protein YcdF (DUF218 family)
VHGGLAHPGHQEEAHRPQRRREGGPAALRRELPGPLLLTRARLFGAAALLALAAGTGLLFTTHAGAWLLQWSLEAIGSTAPLSRLRDVQAIALLGGRTDRVHTAAQVARSTGLPVLIAGKGTGDAPFAAESEKMEQILRERYGIRARWVEKESLDTTENARFSWCLLGPQGIRRVALVTDPRHMLRARLEYLMAGFDPLPVPTRDQPEPQWSWAWENFKPSRAGIAATRPALKEWAGSAAVLVETAFGGGIRSAPSPGRAPPRSCTPPPGTAARDRDAHRGGGTAASR